MENQPTILDKAVKISIISGALIVALSLAYYLVVFLPNKEEARVEQQRQEQQAKEQQVRLEQESKEQKEQAVAEQSKKEYIAKRKNECYQIYLKEKNLWNNVEESDYSVVRDVCIVTYRDDKPRRSEQECSKILENMKNLRQSDAQEDSKNFLEDILTRSYFDCSNHYFSKDF